MRSIILFAVSAGMMCAQQSASDAQAQLREALQQMKAQQKAQILLRELGEVQAALEELRTRYTESHPDVVELRATLQQLRAKEAMVDASLKLLPPEAPPPDTPKLALPDRWWKNRVTSQYLALTADQQKKMDEVVQQFRARLTTASAELQRQETALEPLVAGEPVDETRVGQQIDRVAEARAELEKANGRMLLGIRKLLTPEQWVKLNQAFTLSVTPQ